MIKKFIEDFCIELYKTNIIDYSDDFERVSVGFEITHRCNLKCKHCCFSSTHISDKSSINNDLETEKLLFCFDKIISYKRVSTIQISGGEPMIRKDFDKILEYVRDKFNGIIVLSTNATLINEKNVDMISKCVDQIDISIDGVDEKTCSIVRGRGVFDKVIKSIKLLKSKDICNISLSMVFGDKNEHLREEFFDLCEKLKVKPMERTFSIVGRGKDNADIFLENMASKYYLPSDYYDFNVDKITSRSCGAISNQVLIRSNGDIFPCPTYSEKKYYIGNLLEDDLEKVCSRDFCFDLVEQKFYKENCEKCIVEPFCWTCPGEINEINTTDILNDRCSRLKNHLVKKIWGE